MSPTSQFAATSVFRWLDRRAYLRIESGEADAGKGGWTGAVEWAAANTSRQRLSKITVALQQDVEIILPGSAELSWGGLAFVLVSAALLAMVFFVVRAATWRSGRAEVDHWRERALRAEAERDLLSQHHEDT